MSSFSFSCPCAMMMAADDGAYIHLFMMFLPNVDSCLKMGERWVKATGFLKYGGGGARFAGSIFINGCDAIVMPLCLALHGCCCSMLYVFLTFFLLVVVSHCHIIVSLFFWANLARGKNSSVGS